MRWVTVLTISVMLVFSGCYQNEPTNPNPTASISNGESVENPTEITNGETGSPVVNPEDPPVVDPPVEPPRPRTIGYKWANGKIPYYFEPDLDQWIYSHKIIIFTVMAYIENNCGVDFVIDRTRSIPNAVKIGKSIFLVTDATIGDCGDNHMSCNIDNSDNHRYPFTYRQLLKVCGLVPEHRRPDRDEYVNIIVDKMHLDASRYEIVYDSIVDYSAFDYDVNSIMNYECWKDGESGTIETKNGVALPYVFEPNERDWQILRSLYGPPRPDREDERGLKEAL